jgi:hypothetical protein
MTVDWIRTWQDPTQTVPTATLDSLMDYDAKCAKGSSTRHS